MKNFNLIEWLWKTDSHEKQSPQRFARYAAMLLLLLTCVTHALGAHKGSNSGFWDDGGLKVTFNINGTPSETTLNSSSPETTSLGTITTGLSMTKTVINFWTNYGTSATNSTVYWELYKSSTKIGSTYERTTSTAGTYSGSNSTYTVTTTTDILALTTGPGSYTVRVYAKFTSSEGTYWYNRNTNNGYYSFTFTIPSKNLTVNGAANGNTVSGSVTGVTKGTAYTITATPTAGYVFSGWSTSDSHITIGNTSSASTTVTFNNYSANATVTASFTAETSHTVTHSEYCTSTSTQLSTENVSVGEVTYSEFNAPVKKGYNFTGWTVGNGLSIKAGDDATASTNPIHVRTLSSGSYTLRANYTEVLTTTWYLLGNNTNVFPGTSTWSTHSTNMLQKASGHSADDEGSLTINVKAIPANNSDYQCKVYNSDGNHWWGWTNNYTYNVNSSAHTNITLHEASNNNLYFIPNALGNYTFKVDWSGESPVLNVTWPTSYAIQFAKGTVNGSTGNITAKYNTVAFNSNTKIQSGQTITLIAPDEKEGYTWAGWFNNNAGSGVALSTDKTYTPTVSAATTYYACYTINNHDITYTTPSNGSYTIKVGDAAAVSTNTTSDYGKTITLSATRNWGYDFTGWTVTKDGGGSITPSSSASSNPATFSMPDDDVTVSATFTAKNCTITLNNQGADSGKEGTTSVSTTYNTNTNLTSNITCPTKTGWKFQGYWSNTNGNGVQVIAADGSWISTVSGYMYEGKWVADGNATLYAYWVKASTYTFRYGTSGSEDWNGTAFTQVDATTTWQIENFTIPNKPNFYVGYEGLFYESGLGTGATKSKSVTRAWTDAPTAVSETYQGQMVLLPAGPTAGAIGQATGATGTLKIYTDSKHHNLYVGFEPSGYGVTRASGTLPFVSSSGTWRETNVVTLNSSDASGNFQVKLKTSSSYVATSHGTAENATAVNGRKITGDADIANGKKGVFQMWTDATSNNFGLRFVTVHDVTFDMQGHGDAISKYTDVRYGNKISAPSDPSASGYVFGGWYKDDDCTDDWDFANDVVTEATTLHAKWEANVYKINLDNQGASSPGTLDGCLWGATPYFEVTYGTPYLKCYLNTAPSKLGYDFHGWYSGVGGAGDLINNQYTGILQSSTVYTDGDGKWTNAGDVTVYAKWTMTISGSGCIHADKIAYTAGGMTMTYNSSTITSFTPASKTGYILQGYWNADSDGDKIINADGTFVGDDVEDWVEDGKWVYEGTTPTICAHFEPITYHIAFDPDNIAKYVNDATGSMETIDATYDEYVTLPANTFTRTDYNFLGWAKGSDSTTYTWMDKSSAVINLTRTDDATVTLYAYWQGVSVTVSFNKGAGYSVYPTSTTLHVGETYGQGSSLSEGELPTPSAPAGYAFAGWYTSASGGTLVTKNTQLTVSGDHTLYAHYTKADRVYFKNTLGWDKVYVTWDAEWNRSGQDKGAGSYGKTQELMTNISGTDIWYKDIPAAILSDWAYNIAFTEKSMSNYEWFDEGQAVFRRDFDKNTTLFVPMKTDPNTFLKNKHDSKTGTTYYSTKEKTDGDGKYKNGYWMKYEDLQAGYSLKGSWNWVAEHFIERSTTSDSVYSYTMKGLSANTTYYYKLYKLCSDNTTGSVFSTSTSITSATAADAAILNAEVGDDNASFKTTVAGDYTFKFNLSKTGVIKLTIEYPFKANDYRVVYGWNDGSAHTFTSEIIKKSASTNDTISMFIHKVETPVVSRSLTIQKCTGVDGSGNPTWTAGNTIDLSSITKSGVYNFVIEQPASGEPTGSFWKKYDGNFYIRMDSVEGGWDQYKYHPENIMTYSEYSLTQTLSAPYSHYYCKYVGNSSTDISYTVATDYSPMICPVLEGDATIGVGNKTLYSGKPASVRFTYNEETNGTFRSYLKSAQGAGNTRFLVMHGTDNKLRDKDGNEIAANVGASLLANELLFTDTENWVYEVSIQAKPGAQVSIIARYNDVDRYLVGGDSSWETILGGSGDKAYSMKAVYDFKTNRLMTAWTPLDTVTEALSDAEVLIERHNQDGATVITFGKASAGASAGSISAKRVIGALRFDYSELVGRVASWTTETRAKMMFFVSFPFDVNISDIFGLNSAYREAYIIQKYNGAKRAEKGFFLGDGTTSFWEILPIDSVMHAGQGYVVTMDNDYLNGDKGHVWDNKRSGDHVYLYFPSATSVTINSNAQTINVPAHECKINRTFSGGKLNHKYTDSNWNLMGVPVFRNDTADATAGTAGAIFTPTSEPTDTTAYIEHPELGYFYEWNTSKTYTIRSAVGFVFKPMHSYMVQYAGDVTFKAATPKIVAAVRKARKDENYNIELQVLNNANEMLDHTYVELRENAVDTFALNEDTYTMPDSKAVNVYTFAGTYDVAANVLSIGNHVVPVGVIVNKAGTCTFSMPSNFSGTVTLIDKFAQTRTNLMMEDYEVYLEKGTIDDRFELEINIHNAPTAIDGVGVGQGSLKDGKAHKFIMNDMMYILKDGVLYDARGTRVK